MNSQYQYLLFAYFIYHSLIFSTLMNYTSSLFYKLQCYIKHFPRSSLLIRYMPAVNRFVLTNNSCRQLLFAVNDFL